jgi:prevent-host-death family protein
MDEVTILEAKTHLSRLLKRVEAGETLLIKRGDKPVARLVPVDAELPPREWGQWKGQIWIADDFDDPLPDEILRYFTE